ncbi:TPA: cysteine peptidase family C39 domain-containing protein [Streptococcus pneumoniae]
MTSYKRTFVPQIDARDCGVAALASIAKFYGSDFSLAHLRELAKTNKEGTTALGIVKAADEMGFETRPVQADKTLFDMSDVPYPFIVHVNKEGKLQHYYVVYQTQLSDGAGLSGGQKQRIALARALLTKSPVLILDEATSGLDVLTEKKVIDNLMSLTDKTILFVAHRLSIAERTNRVIVLDQGKIIEVGSHQELMQAQGFYHHLFNK